MKLDLFQAPTSPLSSSNYEEFKKRLAESGCRLCGLADSRTHIVVDRGNPAASVLFIGEAPGESEDLSGRAFVGRAGKLLDTLFAEAGFETERDALIANVVKCRPPENRRPKPAEAEACLPFLQKQIELIAPRFIVLLGATALQHLLPSRKSASMAEEVGSFFEHPAYPGIRLCVFYHPAYILRDPRKKPLMQEHMRRFVEAWKAGRNEAAR